MRREAAVSVAGLSLGYQRSQDHRTFGVGRDLCGSPSPTPLPKQGHLQQGAQHRVQAGLEYPLVGLPPSPFPAAQARVRRAVVCRSDARACRELQPLPARGEPGLAARSAGMRTSRAQRRAVPYSHVGSYVCARASEIAAGCLAGERESAAACGEAESRQPRRRWSEPRCVGWKVLAIKAAEQKAVADGVGRVTRPGKSRERRGCGSLPPWVMLPLPRRSCPITLPAIAAG